MKIGRGMSLLILCLGLFVVGTAGQDGAAKVAVPKTIRSVEPNYGDSVKNYGMPGSVSVYVQIDKQGKATVQSAFGPIAPCSDLGSRDVKAINKAATDAAAATVFEPPMKDGKPTDVYVSLMYKFAPAGQTLAPDPLGEKPQTITGGVLNGRVRKLPAPSYPPAARAERASGAVSVQVLLSEKGDVIAAGAVSGHPLLRGASVTAACRARIDPVTLKGVLVRVSGVLTYNFIP